MKDRLCVLTCENFNPELRAVLEDPAFEDVTASSFPASCGRPPLTWDSILGIIGDPGEFTRIHILGCCCLGEMGDPPANLAHKAVIHRFDQCFDTFASKAFTQACLKRSCCILTSGQVLRWRQWIDSMGLDKETARRLFGESVSSIVLLDTGISDQADVQLRQLADFLNLPFELVPIGLDLFRLFINRIVLESAMESQRRNSEILLKKAYSEKAGYAMALNVVSSLTANMDETDVVRELIDLMETIFGASKVQYLPLEGQQGAEWKYFLELNHPEAIDNNSAERNDFSWTLSGNGFSMPIMGRDAAVGIIVVDDLTFPEDRQRYVNLALQIMGIFGLAIENAHSHRQMVITQDRLRESEEKFRTVANHNLDWEIWVAPDGRLIHVSPSCENITGYYPDEFIENPGLISQIIHPDDRELVGDHFDKIDDSPPHTIQYRIITRSGEERWIEHVCQAVYGDEGKWLGRRAGNRDVTSRVLAEQENQALQTQLFQSQKLQALGTLVGGLAHDFNNMLQIITAYTENVMDGFEKTSKQYSSLNTIVQTSMEGAELIRKLLAFGQQAQVISKPLDLNHQLREIGSLITRTLPNIEQLELSLADGDITIKSDHNQLRQLVMNLAINASEAFPEAGALKISTRRVTLDDDYCRTYPGVKPGPFVKMTVEDNGRGMDTAVLKNIFDPFFSTKQRGTIRGTGLGLSVVRGIVQQHGGIITCESEPGEGTKFKIWLPEIPAAPQTMKTTPHVIKTDGHGTIMVVEDSIIVAEMEQTVLESAGYKVILALNGLDAIKILRERKDEISMVILDLIMPQMSGKDCLKELLTIDPSLRVLVLSGYNPESELAKDISPYIRGFLHKPCKMTQLVQAVSAVIAI